MADVAKINTYLQGELRRRGLESVKAVEAARWLDDAGLLDDRTEGLPLRNLLRAKRISGGSQEPDQKYGKWYIHRL